MKSSLSNTRIVAVKQLIMDVGMHLGKDTEFYLKKGFRVVAVEARPDFVSLCSDKFSSYIASGDLNIVPMAISDKPGTVSFTTFDGKDDWGTANPSHVARNVSRGYNANTFEVPSTTLSEIISRCGVPYYLKIDIEGCDLLCVGQLFSLPERPRYISIEAPVEDISECNEAIDSLAELGYRKFKIVNQQLHYKHRCPNPPREGVYFDQRFDTFMSGPFGEESPGDWKNEKYTRKRLRGLCVAEKILGKEGKLPFLRSHVNSLRAAFGLEPYSWYDIHAAF